MRRATLPGEDDLVLGLALGVRHDRYAVVVEIEHAGRPERAVPRPHADLTVDLDRQRHHAPPTTTAGPYPRAQFLQNSMALGSDRVGQLRGHGLDVGRGVARSRRAGVGEVDGTGLAVLHE